jgi:ankyrin repeat protein
VPVADALVKSKGCNLDLQDSTGRSPLHW